MGYSQIVQFIENLQSLEAQGVPIDWKKSAETVLALAKAAKAQAEAAEKTEPTE